jgi:hypothetical protein
MNKQAIFTFIKKNLLSLICGTIAVLAIALIFYPIGGMLSELQSKVDERTGLYDQLKGFLKPRKLPISDPTAADPGDLPGMPNKPTITAGQAAVDKFKAASDQMINLIVSLNQKGHTPLAPGVLPKLASQSSYFTFAEVYKLVLSTDPAVHGVSANPSIAADPKLQTVHALNLQNDVLNGAYPPLQAQIDNASLALWKDEYEPQIITVNGKPVNQEELATKWTAEKLKLPKKMKGQVATSHKIYVEPTAFTVSPDIQPNVVSDLDKIWNAQMQLWVQQDLAAGIADANAKSSNILDAVVKRLLVMQMPIPGTTMYVCPPASAAAPGGGGSGGTGNVPATADEKAPIPAIYSVSPTGRYSNGMYDVVTFRLVVDVDASKVNAFIQTLQQNRLITITNENAYALDSEFEAQKGYLYGPNSCVRLVLDGEELFMWKWTHDLMPDTVQIMLGRMAAPAGTTPGMSPVRPMMPGGGGFNPGQMPPGMMPPSR